MRILGKLTRFLYLYWEQSLIYQFLWQIFISHNDEDIWVRQNCRWECSLHNLHFANKLYRGLRMRKIKVRVLKTSGLWVNVWRKILFIYFPHFHAICFLWVIEEKDIRPWHILCFFFTDSLLNRYLFSLLWNQPLWTKIVLMCFESIKRIRITFNDDSTLCFYLVNKVTY